MDGITDETNSKFRVGAKLAPALYGVKELSRMKKERGIRFPILHHRFIAMNHNEHEIAELPAFSTRNQFDMLSVRTLSVIDGPDDAFTRLKPSDESLRAYEYRDGQRIRRHDYICEKAFSFPIAFADGQLGVCDQDCNGQQIYGSLADGKTLKEVWFGQQGVGIRKVVRDHPDDFSFCHNCPFRDRPVTDCSIKTL